MKFYTVNSNLKTGVSKIQSHLFVQLPETPDGHMIQSF